jgi:hypothetical protein
VVWDRAGKYGFLLGERKIFPDFGDLGSAGAKETCAKGWEGDEKAQRNV